MFRKKFCGLRQKIVKKRGVGKKIKFEKKIIVALLIALLLAITLLFALEHTSKVATTTTTTTQPPQENASTELPEGAIEIGKKGGRIKIV